MRLFRGAGGAQALAHALWTPVTTATAPKDLNLGLPGPVGHAGLLVRHL